MRKIIVNSKKHGRKEILLDNEDYKILSKFKWSIIKDGNTYYASRQIELPRIEPNRRKRRRVIMHREILGITDPKIFGDHKDGNGLNNQRNNIRIADQRQNMGNQRKRKGATSKYVGVCWVKKRNKWMAFLQTNGISNNIGFYEREIDAAKARDIEAAKIFGEHAKLNFK